MTSLEIPVLGGTVDPARLERSLGLFGRRIAPGKYLVAGGEEQHWVDVEDPSQPRCDCGDHLWRERTCKHILAALLREGDERVLRAVGSLVYGLRSAAA
jgi:hypothetical protein